MPENDINEIVERAKADPSDITDKEIEWVVTQAENGPRSSRHQAVQILNRIAKTDSDRIVHSLDTLLARLEDSEPVIRFNAALTVRRVATESPDAVEPYLDELIEYLIPSVEPYGDVRAEITNALDEIAQERPELIEKRIDKVQRVLRDEDEDTIYYGTFLCKRLSPTVLETAGLLEDLLQLAERDDERIGRSARSALRSLAENDNKPIKSIISRNYPEFEMEDADISDVLTAIRLQLEIQDPSELSEIQDRIEESLDIFDEVPDPLQDEDLDKAIDTLDLLGEYRRLGIARVTADLLRSLLKTEQPTISRWENNAKTDQRIERCGFGTELDGELWNCPRDVREGSEFCLLHAPLAEKDPTATERMVLDELNKPASERVPLAGTRLAQLDISNEQFGSESSEELDLRQIYVRETLDCSHTRFEEPVSLAGAVIMGEADFDYATVSRAFDASGISVGRLTARNGKFKREVKIDNSIMFDFLFSDAEFSGTLQADDATIGEMSGEFASFDKGIRMPELDLWFESSLYGISSERPAMFMNASVRDEFDIGNSDFGGALSFSESTFESNLLLSSVSAEGRVSFARATVEGSLDISSSRFAYPVMMSDTTIKGELDGFRARFTDAIRAIGAEFAGPVDWKWTEFRDGTFAFSEFKAEVLFNYITVDQKLSFLHSNFNDDTDLVNISCEELNCTSTTFDKGADLQRSAISSIDFDGTQVEDGHIDFTAAEVGDGQIVFKRTKTPKYDFRDASIGPISLLTADDSAEMKLISHCRFLNTEFDQFDFGQFKDELTMNNWQIHTVDGELEKEQAKKEERINTLREMFEPISAEEDTYMKDVIETVIEQYNIPSSHIEQIVEADDHEEVISEDDLPAPIKRYITNKTEPTRTEPRPVDKENTYLRAKTGANMMGDSKSAAEFFIKEMKYRRGRHAEVARDDNSSLKTRIRTAANWFGNVGLYLTTGYGYRLRNVGIISGLIISVWALLFSIFARGSGASKMSSLNNITDLTTFDGWQVIFENLYLSTVTFTSLGYGDIQPANSITRALAGVEALFGALLTALIVFVIGRRIDL